MALVTVTTTEGDITLSLEVGDLDLTGDGGTLDLERGTAAEIARGIARALNASERADYDLPDE